ncbi:hypothetical protein ES708_09814 [subsurface metagenome]
MVWAGVEVPAIWVAPVQNMDRPVGMLGNDGFMSDQDNGIALPVEFIQQAHDLLPGNRVQVAGRFIGQNNGRVVHHGPGNGHPLALAAAQFAGPMGGPVRQAHPLQDFLGLLDPLTAVNTGVNQGEFHIPQGRGTRQEIKRLEDEADFPVPDGGQLVVIHLDNLVALHVTDQFPFKLVAPLGGGIEATDDIHEGRFTRPRGTHDGDVVVGIDGQIDAAQGVDLLIPHFIYLGHIFKGYDRVMTIPSG